MDARLIVTHSIMRTSLLWPCGVPGLRRHDLYVASDEWHLMQSARTTECNETLPRDHGCLGANPNDAISFAGGGVKHAGRGVRGVYPSLIACLSQEVKAYQHEEKVEICHVVRSYRSCLIKCWSILFSKYCRCTWSSSFVRKLCRGKQCRK